MVPGLQVCKLIGSPPSTCLRLQHADLQAWHLLAGSPGYPYSSQLRR